MILEKINPLLPSSDMTDLTLNRRKIFKQPRIVHPIAKSSDLPWTWFCDLIGANRRIGKLNPAILLQMFSINLCKYCSNNKTLNRLQYQLNPIHMWSPLCIVENGELYFSCRNIAYIHRYNRHTTYILLFTKCTVFNLWRWKHPSALNECLWFYLLQGFSYERRGTRYDTLPLQSIMREWVRLVV